MIIPEKKTVSIILSKRKKDGGESHAPILNEKEMGEPSPYKIVAQDMMLAFKNGSLMDLETALEAFASHIQAQDEEQDKNEESSEQEE